MNRYKLAIVGLSQILVTLWVTILTMNMEIVGLMTIAGAASWLAALVYVEMTSWLRKRWHIARK